MLIDECGRVIGVNASVGRVRGGQRRVRHRAGPIGGDQRPRCWPLSSARSAFSSTPRPVRRPINASIAARLAADEEAIAAEARARADAEARSADAASRRRQLLIAIGVATVAIAALTEASPCSYADHGPRPAGTRPGLAWARENRHGLGVFLASIAATIACDRGRNRPRPGHARPLSPPASPPPPSPPPLIVATRASSAGSARSAARPFWVTGEGSRRSADHAFSRTAKARSTSASVL